MASMLGYLMQGFAGAAQRVASSSGGAGAGGGGGGSTVWGAHHLPQNRDITMLAAGDGSLSLWRYQYPDQRKVKVSTSAVLLGAVLHSTWRGALGTLGCEQPQASMAHGMTRPS